MKKILLLLASLIASNVLATDATVSWVTLAGAKNCPGYPGHSPGQPISASWSSHWKTNSWRTATTNDGPPYVPGDTIWIPQPLPTESYVEIGSGEMTATSTNQWRTDEGFFLVHSLIYPSPQCCVHTGYVCMVIKDFAVFSGGGAGLPLTTNVSEYNFQMSPARNHKEAPFFNIVHAIDDFNQRTSYIEMTLPGGEFGCNPFQKREVLMSTNRVPDKLQIRSGPTNEAGGVFMNHSLTNGGWVLMTNFTHDANGDADIDISGWGWSTNHGFLMITNAP